MNKNLFKLKHKLSLLALISLLMVMVSFKGTDSTEKKHKPQGTSITEKFITELKNGKPLASFFADGWILIYHEDNRCTGSTDGQLTKLKNNQIDKVLTLKVHTDGDGWGCDKQEPKNYDFSFSLKKLVKEWNRFVNANYENQEENSVTILGGGESDYIELFYNANNLIVKMKYSSEDPG
ncbi:hypothetical protein JBL43_16510 [Aureibaculum sp. A20]|uniref:Secreted protein n=1 Tax=Aureibaculum flavum TaxID=2795986 RepID=A0ABS0WV46_9FLAO|nr:hypothetical protein [Aureibaculum flavum]MBJ2175858.1 hypothetical protein [Aureibaculum flavum]